MGADHKCHTYLFSAELELVTLLHRKIFFGQKIAVIMKKTVSNIFVLLRDMVGETTGHPSNFGHEACLSLRIIALTNTIDFIEELVVRT